MTYRLGVCTDIHLDWLSPTKRLAFASHIKNENLDALLITGDISLATMVAADLKGLQGNIGLPVYFVLGNHDYYRGSFDTVKFSVREACKDNKNLFWLTDMGTTPLADKVCLIGHDGWYDGLNGKAILSPLLRDWDGRWGMQDFNLISDFFGLSAGGILDKLRDLTTAAAAEVKTKLEAAVKESDSIIFATHIPPFRGACWHEGNLSDDNWAPFFSNKLIGDVLVEVMSQHPSKHLTVLTGHTHSYGQYLPLPNLEVLTLGAVYGYPQIGKIVTF